MRGFALVLALVSAQPAHACHRFHRWAYPYPQRCGLSEERVNVEITITPALLETWGREDAIELLRSRLK